MNVPRTGHSATLLPNGLVLVVGGELSSGNPTSTAELYDPNTGTWRLTHSGLHFARAGHTATLLGNGTVLIAGGFDVNGNLSSVEIFDSTTEQFTLGPSLQTARRIHTAALLKDGRVLVVGGYSGSLSSFATTGTAEAYDPSSGTWAQQASMPLGLTFSQSTLLADGTVLVTGGESNGSFALANVFLYDPAANTWKTMNPLIFGRQSHTASLLPNGKVLIVGGNNRIVSTSAVELYDASAGPLGQSTSLSPIPEARAIHRAVSLPGGNVLIVGGQAQTGFVLQAEMFDFASQSWSAGGTLNFGRAGHTATLLPSGQVLVAGGVSNTNTGTPAIASTEIWTGSVVGTAIPAGLASAGGTVNPQQSASEPISTGNGNYYYTHTDFVVPGKGMPLIFTRQYNSLDSYAGPLGANWTDSYNIFLTQDSAGKVTIKWGDGHNETFTPSGTGYTDQPGVFSTLTKNADASFLLLQKDRTRYNFSAAGKLASIQDRNGNTILLTYDGFGNLSEVADAVGRRLTFSYDGSNRITQVTDPIGRTITFGYDASDNLVQATDSAGGITQFAYDASHRVISITLPNGQLLLENTYDARGRVVSQKNGREFAWTFAYDTPNPGETTITDARGNKSVHTYDTSLRIVKIADALGGSTSFTYDANNDRASVTNPNGKTTNFAYDAHGNVTSITDPLAHTVAFTYDSRNNLLTATNAKGNTTVFSYDGNGNLSAIQDALGNKTTFAYDGFGELTSKTDARGNTTGYSYDGSGNLVRITDPLGNVTSLNYDGISRLLSITDPNGHTANATYDPLSRLVKIADPLGNATQFAYDPVGNLLKIADANGNATSYGYDATNNLVSVTDAMGHVTRYGYDENNNRTTFTNAKGNTTSYAFDALNRLASITDPLSFTTLYAYDAAGNVVATTDAKGQTNRFTFDALNRLIAISYADGKSVAYSYDANGNRTALVDSHGTTAYAYAVLDRLVSVTHPDGKVVRYGYDSIGNRQSLTYPDGKTVDYAYDPANRLFHVKDWLGRTTSYGYDAGSNLLQVLYPNHAGVSFAYDAANRLTEVRNRFRGSGEGEGDNDRSPLAVFRYALDSVGNRLQVADDSGKITRYGYDPLYELTSVQKLDEDDAEDSGEGEEEGRIMRYTYDAVGNRLSLTGPHHVAIDYVYDAGDRLLRSGTSTFTYDANGNQTSKTQTATGQPIVFSYDAANRLISVNGGRFNSNFAYDGDGNRVSQSTGTSTFNYLNDIATALPVVLQESGPDATISYAYGLSRISESSAEFDFFYQYDGLGSVVGLTDPRGHLRARYAYDAWGQSVPPNEDDRIRARDKFRFTGEALDPGTGLYFLRARYYDPSVGRFIGRDPFPGLLRLPLSMNRYQYGLGNPNRYTDPSGLSSADSLSSDNAVSSTAQSSCLQFAGPIIYTCGFQNVYPGPAFQRQVTKTLEDAALGDVLNLTKEITVGILDAASRSVSPQEALSQAVSIAESTVGLLSHRLGTILDIFNLAFVPEIAK